MVEHRPSRRDDAASGGALVGAFSALGLVEDQKPSQVEYLWPENVRTWIVWNEVQTQWRTGMSGATGLDYAGVRAHLDEVGLEGDERRQVYDGIRAMERATLSALSALREHRG